MLCWVASVVSDSVRPYFGLSPGSSLHGILQEYWSGLLCPSLGDLPDPGIEPESLKSPALTGRFLTTSATTQNMISPGLIYFITVSVYLWTSNRYLSNRCPNQHSLCARNQVRYKETNSQRLISAYNISQSILADRFLFQHKYKEACWCHLNNLYLRNNLPWSTENKSLVLSQRIWATLNLIWHILLFI